MIGVSEKIILTLKFLDLMDKIKFNFYIKLCLKKQVYKKTLFN